MLCGLPGIQGLWGGDQITMKRVVPNNQEGGGDQITMIRVVPRVRNHGFLSSSIFYDIYESTAQVYRSFLTLILAAMIYKLKQYYINCAKKSFSQSLNQIFSYNI